MLDAQFSVKMVVETRNRSRSDALNMQLHPCSKHNEDESSSQTLPAANTIRTYKRRKHTAQHVEAECQLTGKSSTKENLGSISDGSWEKTDNQTNAHLITAELCQRIFNDVILSEKFDILCKLLSENFEGVKIESFSDFNVINIRIREGVYGHSPQLFCEDIQKLWSTIQKVGVEMVSLAKGLSDLSQKLYHEQVGGSANGSCVEGNDKDINQVHLGSMEFLGFDISKQYSSLEADQQCKLDQSDAVKSIFCKCCGGKTDNRLCIVCDSCENMYHIFCVGVSVTQGSPRSWYCMNCVHTGAESPHEKCVVCEKVSDPSTETHVSEEKLNTVNSGELNIDEKSNCCMEVDVVQHSIKSTSNKSCKFCKCEFNDKEFRECEHFMCSNKFHLRCLSDIELKRFGRRWYCTSCLCRVCLVDRDDEDIVICDGCDNAYHIYCMEPPLTTIPEGKWFCRLCYTMLQSIWKAKRTYENLENRHGSNAGIMTAVGSVSTTLSVKKLYQNDEKDQMDDISRKVNEGVEHINTHFSLLDELKSEEKLI